MSIVNGQVCEDVWEYPANQTLIDKIYDGEFLDESGHTVNEYRPGDDNPRFESADDAVYCITSGGLQKDEDLDDGQKKWMLEHDLVLWWDSTAGIRVYWCDANDPNQLAGTYLAVVNTLKREYGLLKEVSNG